MKYDDHRNATAWWGACENEGCYAAIVVYPHMDAESDLPDMDEWENGGPFSDCYVCDGRIEWGGSDSVKDVLR